MACGVQAAKPRKQPDRQELNRAEHEQHGGSADGSSDPLRYQGTQKTAQGTGAGDLPEAPFRRARLESLGGDLPES